MEGDPPERYQLEYRIKSLRMVGGELQAVQSHLVEVTLPRNYPRLPPQCRMLSPVFHPNIAPHAICVGDHWGAGESLESIIIRIGEMLAYQSYNVKSPLNGEAARWVEVNKHRIPLDTVSLLPEEEGAARESAVTDKRSPRLGEGESGSGGVPKQHVSSSPPLPVSPTTRSASAPATTPPAKIQTGCPQCGTQYRVSAQAAGRKVRCPKCEHSFTCAAGASDKAS
jgi:predicted Zn finger-like uncharacterized protein